MSTVFISLGSNLGDCTVWMQKMEEALSHLLSPPIIFSPLYATEPIGVDDSHPVYLNRIACGEYKDSPEKLLEELQEIERLLMREKKGLLSPRTADLDIILFGKEIRQTAQLTIPHHGLFKRRFVLEGLATINDDIFIPGINIILSTYLIPLDISQQKISINAPSYRINNREKGSK